LKRKIRVFVSDFSFFSLHSSATELKKDEIWDKNTILQPIEKSLNDFNIIIVNNIIIKIFIAARKHPMSLS
jgi:hypothetical protein